MRFDRFELDEADARLLRDGTAVALAPTPFAAVATLLTIFFVPALYAAWFRDERASATNALPPSVAAAPA